MSLVPPAGQKEERRTRRTPPWIRQRTKIKSKGPHVIPLGLLSDPSGTYFGRWHDKGQRPLPVIPKWCVPVSCSPFHHTERPLPYGPAYQFLSKHEHEILTGKHYLTRFLSSLAGRMIWRCRMGSIYADNYTVNHEHMATILFRIGLSFLYTNSRKKRRLLKNLFTEKCVEITLTFFPPGRIVCILFFRFFREGSLWFRLPLDPLNVPLSRYIHCSDPPTFTMLVFAFSWVNDSR